MIKNKIENVINNLILPHKYFDQSVATLNAPNDV